jgi:hypothetical protein
MGGDERARREREPAGGPRPRDDLFAQLPEDARKALESLRPHGKRIAARLEQDEQAYAHFVRDPIGALKAMGIEVPPELQRVGRPNPQAQELLRAPTVRLPSGQTVTPNVRIRFVHPQDD